MLDLSKKLLYYKRREIQTRIVESCQGREVGIKYGDNGYGKRPDILVYENDVLESVKKGATSFHVSEERWENPLSLSTEMKKNELEELRIGWDLVLDIDCPYWFYSKLTAHMFIKALKRHGIETISCKFSGNKGFHIGVPFEAFPNEINGTQTKNWFPEGPKKIALYLLDYIATNFIIIDEKGEINFDNIHKTSKEELSKTTNKLEKELSINKCIKCKHSIKERKTILIKQICPRCSLPLIQKEGVSYLTCQKCNFFSSIESIEYKCPFCGAKEPPKEFFDPLSIIDIDTFLISSRHMYRAPYSMHEKSGLVSVTFPVDEILFFEKELAQPERSDVLKNPIFLDTTKAIKGEALNLMVSAFDFGQEKLLQKNILDEDKIKNKLNFKFEDINQAVPAELFPPCILKILEGLLDGKKRSLFILTNFLTSVGWTHDMAEKLLLDWNKKNSEPLRDAQITSQINYHKAKKTKVLPPNCRSYYQDFGVCIPDSLCDRIKNPVQYSKRRAFALNKKKPERKVLTEEQKNMRKEYRERLKKEKAILVNSNENKEKRP